MGDEVRDKFEELLKLNKEAINSSKEAIKEAVKEIVEKEDYRWNSLNDEIKRVGTQIVSYEEKNRDGHKHIHERINDLVKSLSDFGGRSGVIDRRQSNRDDETNSVQHEFGKLAMKGWGLIIAAILGCLGKTIFDVLSH